MLQILSEPVQVTFSRQPLFLTWAGRSYSVQKLGLHHHYREGRTLHHVYSVVADGLFFRLNLNTDTMSWILQEVSDGLPN